MKIILVMGVICVFGAVGYLYKSKLEHEYKFLKFISDFVSYYYSNIVLVKNNTVEIINNYIITHENKNANYCKMFSKNKYMYEINPKILNYYISQGDNVSVIENYFFQIGKSEYDYEKEKSKNFLGFLKDKIEESYSNFKNKGNLYFKILISIGAILAILIW